MGEAGRRFERASVRRPSGETRAASAGESAGHDWIEKSGSGLCSSIVTNHEVIQGSDQEDPFSGRDGARFLVSRAQLASPITPDDTLPTPLLPAAFLSLLGSAGSF